MSPSSNPLQQHARFDESLNGFSNVVLFQPHHWSYLKKRYRMTGREVEIAQLICRGLSNEQIAQDLDIKPGTVKTHVRNIYRKAWVNNKIAMLLRFLDTANNLSPLPRNSP